MQYESDFALMEKTYAGVMSLMHSWSSIYFACVIVLPSKKCQPGLCKESTKLNYQAAKMAGGSFILLGTVVPTQMKRPAALNWRLGTAGQLYW